MNRLGIKNRLSSLHQFTAPAKIDGIVKRIRTENAAVAIVSDAGMRSILICKYMAHYNTIQS